MQIPDSVRVFSPEGLVNSVLVRGKCGTVVIDTQKGLEEGQLLKKIALEHAGGGPIRHVIITHEHYDHIVGNQFFDVDIISSETARTGILAASSSHVQEEGFSLKPPNITFQKALKVYLGDVTLNLEHTGGHCPGQSVINIPEIGVLITGDLVFNGRPPFIGNADIPLWIQTLSRLYALNPTLVIPGHGEPGGKELLIEQRKWLETFMDKVFSAKKRGLDEEGCCDWAMNEMNLPQARRSMFLAGVKRLLCIHL